MINSQTKAVDEQLDKILDKLVSYYVGNRESLSPDEAKQSLLQLISDQRLDAYKSGYEQGQFDKEMNTKFQDKDWINKSIDVLNSERMK